MTERVVFGEQLTEASVMRSISAASMDAAPSSNVTAAIVDRAVAETFRGTDVSPEVARVMKNLMGSDSGSAVARAYYHGVAAEKSGAVNAGVSRPELVVSYALSDAQATVLVDYAPDYVLRFAAQESHDHPVAAACRIVDRALVGARLPPGVPVSHVGGAIVPLVQSGMLGKGHHSCTPLIDRKDPARHVLVNLRMRKTAYDMTCKQAVRDAALGYLARDERYVCDKRVQECSYKTPVLTSVHVYDIPMSEWASIMDSKGAHLVEGCLLFPKALFDERSGNMEAAGARYEVDAGRNLFRMGFSNSPAWWYEHVLSDYLKYGVDQVLSAGKSVYSYKIVERRGDTIFFRILRVAATTVPEYVQHYKVPGVQMVRVNGFPVDRDTVSPYRWARRTYLFPRVLWEDMLGHAKEMVERGTLSHEKLFNYYRTVAPRQSINAVVVAGGVSVDDLNHLVPLIVHVAMFAFLEVKKTQIETQAIVDAAMKERYREQEFTLYKVLAAFGETLYAGVKLTVAPLVWIAKMLEKGAGALSSLRACDWSVVPVVQEVSVKLVLPGCFSAEAQVVADFSDEYALVAPADAVRSAVADPALAKFVLQAFGQVLPNEFRNPLEEAMVAEEQASVREELLSAATSKMGESISGDTNGMGTAFTAEISGDEIERRKASILEAIQECEAEADKSEAACASHYRELLVGGSPNIRKLVSRREMFNNPEFWRVSAGVIESSFSGAPVEGFQHAAVFCPVPSDGSRLLSVVEEEFRGMSRGEYVERIYYKIANASYSGWVYTNDSLLIHNGPAVAQALQQALELPLDFYVTLYQGPPGCGKTTSIVKAAGEEDVILIPVRKAARETAQRLSKKGFGFAEMAKTRVRTVDSYLVNRMRIRGLKNLTSNRLLADEAFMTREGRWLAAAAHLGVSFVDAYGDRFQIPHVPRAEAPKQYVTLRYQRENTEWLSHRCPPQLVACWGSVYNWGIRSTSKVVGEVLHIPTSVGREVPSGCVMMGMYQADKKTLREKYANCGVPIQIMTVHESEGNTYKHVWLHRFDLRKRTDNFSLYDKEPYALVAMSRSTHSFVYVAPDLGDMVSVWIKNGKDPRRIAAAADVPSAGERKEKF